MSTPDQNEPPVRAIDRFLAFASLTLIALAIVAFVAIIIGTAVGMKHDDFQSGIWLVASFVMYYGLPVGVGLFFLLLIMNMVRRSRATRAAGAGRKH